MTIKTFEDYLVESTSNIEFDVAVTHRNYMDGKLNQQAQAIVEPVLDNPEYSMEYFRFCELDYDNWANWVRQTLEDTRWGDLAVIINECGY
jgi:hypothetical protein